MDFEDYIASTTSTILNQELCDNGLAAFEKLRVLQTGHFVYSSGYHGSVYLEKDRLFENPLYFEDMLQAFVVAVNNEPRAAEFKKLLNRVSIIVGPEAYGLIASFEIARVLHKTNFFNRGLRRLWWIGIKKDPHSENTFLLSPYQAGMLVDQHVLFADDVLNTGGTLKSIVTLLDTVGARIVAALFVYNRCQQLHEFSFPIFSIAEYHVPPSYLPQECPQCRQGVPITTL